MFHSARLKLTAWYLLIIIFISLAFSFVIYKGLTAEVERFARIQRLRIERRITVQIIPIESYLLPELSVDDRDLVNDIKKRIIFILALVNGLIFILAGVLSYVLAGKTLRPIKEMLEDQNRFITDASHELRTPLTSLKSAMEVHLRDKNLSLKEAKTLIKNNIEDVNKLQALSDSLLQLAQYEKPNGYGHFKTVSITNILKKDINKINPLAKKKEIKIVFKSAEYSVEGNEFGLTDLFLVLLDNAIKYSPRRSQVMVGVTKSDGFLLVTVADRGMGINKDDLPHLFDRFYRSNEARNKAGIIGYGLGLSIAKKIVDTHKGEIFVKSQKNNGTEFVVKLPTNKIEFPRSHS